MIRSVTSRLSRGSAVRSTSERRTWDSSGVIGPSDSAAAGTGSSRQVTIAPDPWLFLLAPGSCQDLAGADADGKSALPARGHLRRALHSVPERVRRAGLQHGTAVTRAPYHLSSSARSASRR